MAYKTSFYYSSTRSLCGRRIARLKSLRRGKRVELVEVGHGGKSTVVEQDSFCRNFVALRTTLYYTYCTILLTRKIYENGEIENRTIGLPTPN